MRRKIAAGNWKMNLSFSEARDLCTAINMTKVPSGTEVILAVPAPYLYILNAITERNKSVHIAAQNLHSKEKGAFTGETSPQMLTSIGVKYVLVGHSERRQYNKETNAELKAKVDIALANRLSVIFCCGEPLAIRKKKTQDTYVAKQLKESLFHLTADQLDSIVVAYEPIWAIGTGVTASPAQAQQMHKSIRSLVSKNYNSRVAAKLPILYGGSVKPANAKDLFSRADVDGGLVGGASLKADSFTNIIKSF